MILFPFTLLSGLREFIVATGGTVTTSGDYKTHEFFLQQVESFDVISAPAGATVEVMLVGGGGGGGFGGGGGGGYVYDSAFPVSVGSYPTFVGPGGEGYSGAYSNGVDTTFGTLTAIGGGKGGAGTDGLPGGSGGGGSAAGNPGGAAQQPGSASGGYGNVGGNCNVDFYDGGGGGAGGAGNINGVVGPGRTADIGTGTFAVGGFGKNGFGTQTNADGAENTGNGGAAEDGNGGSGIIRVRYQYK